MNTSIRYMTRQDRAPVLRIVHNIKEFTPSEMAVAEEVIDDYLEDPLCSGYNISLAIVDRQIVGYICFGPAPMTNGTWDIYWMAVDPKWQSRGIGHTLMTHAEHLIRHSKGRLIIIETSSKPEYEKTRRFHVSHGYEISCKIEGFYAPDDDKLVLMKRLNHHKHINIFQKG